MKEQPMQSFQCSSRYRRATHVFLFALATLSIPGFDCLGQSAPPTDASAVVTKGFIYETAPFPECHASTLVETNDGLLCAWFGGTEERDPDVGIWTSRLIHGRWSTPVEVATGIQYRQLDPAGKEQVKRYPCWNPVLMQQPGGELYLFYKIGPTPSDWWGMVMSSQDAGKTWSLPRRLPEGILGPVKNKGMWLKSGDLLCPTSTEEGGPWRVYFERAQPPFAQWSRTSLLATADGKGGIQPTLLMHADGRIQALCRCDGKGKFVLETSSVDGGVHWSELKPTNLPNPNSGLDGVTLSDGRHLLVYNHTQNGGESPRSREMINVAISSDGNKWLACETLALEAGAEFSYPAVIQTSDGMVHITYTWYRKKIAYAMLDPSKLQGPEIVDARWPKITK